MLAAILVKPTKSLKSTVTSAKLSAIVFSPCFRRSAIGCGKMLSRRRSFSRRRLACSSAFFRATSTFSRLSGFSRKSKAPARVASTASAIVPCPEIMIAGARVSFCWRERSRSMPLPSGRRMSNRNASARCVSPFLRNSATERQIATA